MTTEQAARAVETGAGQASLAGESIQGLEASVGEAARIATEIVASSEEQLVGMNHVARAMDRIKLATVENVDAARRLEVAARNLNTLGQQLTDLAEQHHA
jgi:methyl-accepting chemotaxis protein